MLNMTALSNPEGSNPMPDAPVDYSAPNIANPTSASYDEVPYDSHPFAQTHPSRLFTVATLFGLRPTAVTRCRVLELGCAAGGNLIPMADYLPDSEFVGVDLSAKQIEHGRANVAKLGLRNIILKHASITDVDVAYGQFDYIIAHGVYSWVPEHVREKILNICGTMLTPNGVAYVSYNTYPGWHMRGMIRDMMRYHASRFNTAQLKTQQSRALLDFLATNTRQDGPYSQLLKQEVETLRHQADHYLYHEHLEDVNDPLYFHQFIDGARKHNLTYLGEARIGSMVTGNFGPDVEKTLKMLATDQIQVEQYMDFLRNRMFRETLLCSNKLAPNWSVQPETLRGLHVASGTKPILAEGQTAVNLRSEENQMYQTPANYQIGTNRPLLKAAIQLLQQVFPATIPFDTLRKKSRELIGGFETANARQQAEDTQLIALGLLNCYLTSDMIEFHGIPVPQSPPVSEKPIAMPWARITATEAGHFANRRHEVIRLNPLDRQLIPLLDGVNDRTIILERLTKDAIDNILTVQRDGQPLTDAASIREALDASLPHALANLARMGVLIG
jgi:methyltransferase-like protein